jgi:hypothetical protein
MPPASLGPRLPVLAFALFHSHYGFRRLFFPFSGGGSRDWILSAFEPTICGINSAKHANLWRARGKTMQSSIQKEALNFTVPIPEFPVSLSIPLLPCAKNVSSDEPGLGHARELDNRKKERILLGEITRGGWPQTRSASAYSTTFCSNRRKNKCLR